MMPEKNEEKNESGLKDFFDAALRGRRREVARVVSRKGARILNARGIDGRTALSLAAGQGNLSVVRYLLSAGADPDIPDDAGRTPLHVAARVNQRSIFRCLKRHGADLKARDHQGWSVTHHAANSGNTDILRDIFHDGAVLEDRAVDFRTPLHLAARSLQNREAAFFLVDIGADPLALDRKGKTPLDVAVDASQPEIAKGLISAAQAIQRKRFNFTPRLSK